MVTQNCFAYNVFVHCKTTKKTLKQINPDTVCRADHCIYFHAYASIYWMWSQIVISTTHVEVSFVDEQRWWETEAAVPPQTRVVSPLWSETKGKSFYTLSVPQHLSIKNQPQYWTDRRNALTLPKRAEKCKSRTMVVIESFHLDFSACALDRRIRFAGSGGERVSWVARQRIAVFPWYY